MTLSSNEHFQTRVGGNFTGKVAVWRRVGGVIEAGDSVGVVVVRDGGSRLVDHARVGPGWSDRPGVRAVRGHPPNLTPSRTGAVEVTVVPGDKSPCKPTLPMSPTAVKSSSAGMARWPGLPSSSHWVAELA
ncbi:hypothetical protein [Tunturiibacter gelidoferens]|jgi:hypothetical protein|uniref:Uncharacterized protein n=1 Tax=Tunturiibacter gelidiferens TaxID=3069689 RepID=A0A9X0U6D8_9BACT|nr:hypothetical protein [Edaphobacter lichenicola]MBB5329707.1 hypothetical protein [Edaphobacter lichenicola]